MLVDVVVCVIELMGSHSVVEMVNRCFECRDTLKYFHLHHHRHLLFCYHHKICLFPLALFEFKLR